MGECSPNFEKKSLEPNIREQSIGLKKGRAYPIYKHSRANPNPIQYVPQNRETVWDDRWKRLTRHDRGLTIVGNI
jgi:hypothetical protein